MIEFGSDYHRCEISYQGENTIHSVFHSNQLFGNGRMAVLAIAKQEDWKRIWVPAYFCHEIIDVWKTFFEICLYDDHPLQENDEEIVRTLPYLQGDALLRMNFFGLRTARNNDGIPVPVIEDHSHSPISEWSLHSNADWCFASLRKSMPIAFGGILWSPKGHTLPSPSSNTSFNKLANERYRAMALKSDYLQKGGDKEAFRTKFITTEEGLSAITNIVSMDPESMKIIRKIDIIRWNEQRLRNWRLARRLLTKFEIMGNENCSSPFSIVIRMPNTEERNRMRTFLRC